jgi:hypothetical protein
MFRIRRTLPWCTWMFGVTVMVWCYLNSQLGRPTSSKTVHILNEQQFTRRTVHCANEVNSSRWLPQVYSRHKLTILAIHLLWCSHFREGSECPAVLPVMYTLRRSHPLQNDCHYVTLAPTESDIQPYVQQLRSLACKKVQDELR